MKINILKDELWYGALTHLGTRMPFDENTDIEIDLSVNTTPNQGMPFLISNKGRWIWLNTPYKVSFKNGSITASAGSAFGKSGESLKSAYEYVDNTYLPQTDSMPDERFFLSPIFNTWIEYNFHQSEKNTLEYAKEILAAGFKPGVLMIDDSWSNSYGDWTFNGERFPHPEKMLSKLHEMGFAVMLWICPYVTPDTPRFREARDKGLLLTTADGKPFIADWWNGYSAALDLGKKETLKWLRHQLDKLTAIGVDGFKFDGADPMHYVDSYQNGIKTDPNEMARIWAEFATNWRLNEMRASWEAAAMPNLQRLSDKDHSWGENGIASLIPDTLALGIIGHPYSCPDMIGGGQYLNFKENLANLDIEIFIRHAAIAAMMPSLQFSAAPWKILSKNDWKRLFKLLEIREENMKYMRKLLRKTASTNEPMVRYMEYEYPGCGYGRITDQFMLGPDILVAPVLEKGETGRDVVVPEGFWHYRGKEIFGGRTIHIDGEEVPLIVLKRTRS